MPDDRIALIDYGCHCSYDPAERRILVDLYAALDESNKPEIVRTVKAMGYESDTFDEELMVAFATQFVAGR